MTEIIDEKYRTMADMEDEEIFNAMKVIAEENKFDVRDMCIFRSYYDRDISDACEIRLIVLIGSCEKKARCELEGKALKYFMGFGTHKGEDYDISDYHDGMYASDSDVFIYDKDDEESKYAYDKIIERKVKYKEEMSCWKDGEELWMVY